MIKEVFLPLKEVFKDSNSAEISILGFNPTIQEERLYRLLAKGMWSCFFFGDLKYYLFGLRILPSAPFRTWPVIRDSSGNNSCMIAPRLAATVVLETRQYLENPAIFKGYQGDWERISGIFQKFYAVCGGEEYHGLLTEFVMKNANKTTDKKKHLQHFLMFWNQLDESLGHAMFRNMVENANMDKKWVPDSFHGMDLGNWETRILNAAATLAAFRQAHVSRSLRLEHCWRSFCQPHGYDPEELCPEHFPVMHYDTASSIIVTIEALQGYSNFMGLSLEIQDSPLFGPMLSLATRRNTYTGVQHAEAAVLFDTEYNDPLMAWNCLVSAAYWSGRNSSETLLPVWRAAIALCEANNWRDAHEALVHQWDFYHDFKKRNNLP